MSELRLHETVLVPVTKIKRDPTNPNVMSQAQMDGLRNSYRTFGYLQPIILDQDHVIVDGEHRLDIYLESGKTEIPCYVLDLTPENKRLLRQTMNKLHGTHDRLKEADDLKAIYDAGKLGDLASLTGYGQETLIRFIERSYNLGIVHQDQIPSLEESPALVQKGDIWQLGKHRLMCGDSTNKEDVEQLMDGARPKVCMTDPPFSVDYENKVRTWKQGTKTLKTDGGAYKDPESSKKLLTGFMQLLTSDLLIMTYPVDRHFFDLAEACIESKFEFKRECIWLKNAATFSRGLRYQQRHEPILFFVRRGGKPKWDIPNDQSTIFEYPRPVGSPEHPMPRPVEMWSKIMGYHTNKGDSVYDPFLGSGTTLIACEQTERICYGMEIEPRYCDVIIKRWEKLTGQKAEKVA